MKWLIVAANLLRVGRVVLPPVVVGLLTAAVQLGLVAPELADQLRQVLGLSAS